jgi:lipooligosaccharide transport system permease protein
LGFASLTHVVLILPLAFFGGLMFASLAMLFTSLVPNIDSFNYPFFLLITPMFLFSGTFFPLTILPSAGQALAQFLPLTHVVSLALMAIIFFVLSIKLMKRRLIK